MTAGRPLSKNVLAKGRGASIREELVRERAQMFPFGNKWRNLAEEGPRGEHPGEARAGRVTDHPREARAGHGPEHEARRGPRRPWEQAPSRRAGRRTDYPVVTIGPHRRADGP